MAELDTTQRATIDDETDHALASHLYTAVSDDTDVATVVGAGGYLYVYAQSEGTCTITATRNADGATGELEVTVVAPPDAPDPGTFVIKLGAKSPK